MTQWLALSDRSAPLEAGAGICLLAKGTLVLEFELPLESTAVLLDFNSNKNWPRALSVVVDERAGVVVLHRQGECLRRHVLPGPLCLPGVGVGRISFGWDGPDRSWTLTLDLAGQGKGRQVRGRDPMPVLMEDLLQICAGSDAIKRHRAVLWFGVLNGRELPERIPWIGVQAPVETAQGPCRAGKLRQGDLLLTGAGEYAELLSVRHMDLPSRGSFSPVVLRAPYFGASTDILVSSDQLIALSGDEVEYLFGTEKVLTAAGNMTDGRAALLEYRRAVASCVTLDLGFSDLISVDGCQVLAHSHDLSTSETGLPFSVIQDYETTSLLGMLGRTRQRVSA